MVTVKLLALSCAVLSLLELTQPGAAGYSSSFRRRPPVYPGGSLRVGYGQGRATYGRRTQLGGYGASFHGYTPTIQKSYGTGLYGRKTKFVPAGTKVVSKTGLLLNKLNTHAAAAAHNAHTLQNAGLNMNKHLALLSLTKHALGNHVAGSYAGLQGLHGYGHPGVAGAGLGVGGYGHLGAGAYGPPGYGQGAYGPPGYGQGALASHNLQQQAGYGSHAAGGFFGVGAADPYLAGGAGAHHYSSEYAF